MILKTFPFRLALALVTAAWWFSILAQPARADEASKAATIEELFVVTKTDALLQQVMEQVRTMQKAQLEKMQLPSEAQGEANDLLEQIMTLVNERMGWSKLKPLYVKLYADSFTEEELRATLEFYRSPAGRAMLEKMPVLMANSMKMMQDQLGDLTPEISRVIREQTERRREEQEKKSVPPTQS